MNSNLLPSIWESWTYACTLRCHLLLIELRIILLILNKFVFVFFSVYTIWNFTAEQAKKKLSVYLASLIALDYDTSGGRSGKYVGVTWSYRQ